MCPADGRGADPRWTRGRGRRRGGGRGDDEGEGGGPSRRELIDALLLRRVSLASPPGREGQQRERTHSVVSEQGQAAAVAPPAPARSDNGWTRGGERRQTRCCGPHRTDARALLGPSLDEQESPAALWPSPRRGPASPSLQVGVDKSAAVHEWQRLGERVQRAHLMTPPRPYSSSLLPPLYCRRAATSIFAAGLGSSSPLAASVDHSQPALTKRRQSGVSAVRGACARTPRRRAGSRSVSSALCSRDRSR